MKTKTVVELSTAEVVEALIVKAKESAKPAGGGVNVEFDLDEKIIEVPIVRVVFEWGAK